MDQDLKRISNGLRLPQDSRERIRAQLASPPAHQEEIMKKASFKKYIPLIAAAIVVLSLTLTAAAIIAPQFRNDIIVDSISDIPLPDPTNPNAPAVVGGSAPNGTPPRPLEDTAKSMRFKSNGFLSKETINSSLVFEYNKWDDFELLSNDPALRSRRVTRADGAEKMEYTAENPANLIDTLTERVSFDLSWIDKHYDYVPDANFSFVITDPTGGYVGEILEALYTKPDGSGYFHIELTNTFENYGNVSLYVVEGVYETAYYYKSANGYEFLIEMHKGNTWATCRTNHGKFFLYGAYLTKDEVEDILDNLSLSLEE